MSGFVLSLHFLRPLQPRFINSELPRVDGHVHIVGNGSAGTGCWLRLTGWHRPLATLMVQGIGLPLGVLKGDLDRLYIDCLLKQLRSSSINRAVILAQEQVYDDSGKLIENAGSFYVPNDYVLRLGKEHPDLLPAVSIHPARPDALEELEKCLAGGAAMMKILPNCQNIDCNDRRFTKFWERMAEARLPLLAHTGGEHTMPVIEPAYSDPRILALPLECGVNVIAAHCATKSGFTDRDYFQIFQGMLRRFSNLYGDSSAFNLPFRSQHMRDCLSEPMASRLVHGSDFPVPVHGHWAWMRGFVSWKDFRKWERQPNVIERDYELKVAMGYPPAHFTRINSLLRFAPVPTRRAD
jgi:predicted TIM-barrel fold metal-dependent hydrolase